MAKKKFDPKAKAKRQKIIAGVGGVILLGLLAFQVPRTMKMLNPPAPERPVRVASPTTVPTADPSVLPTPGTVGGTGTASAGGAAAGGLISSDVAPAAQAGQLIAFGRFTSKDPFKQQIDPDALQGGGGTSSGGGKQGGSPPSTPGSKPASGGGGAGGGGSGEGVVEPTPKPSGPSVAAGSAFISVNGTVETVAAKADFPKDEPVFTLVSIGRGEVKIAIAGGALASGAPTVTLKKGKAISLVNTADGTRYELVLVGLG